MIIPKRNGGSVILCCNGKGCPEVTDDEVNETILLKNSEGDEIRFSGDDYLTIKEIFSKYLDD